MAAGEARIEERGEIIPRGGSLDIIRVAGAHPIGHGAERGRSLPLSAVFKAQRLIGYLGLYYRLPHPFLQRLACAELAVYSGGLSAVLHEGGDHGAGHMLFVAEKDAAAALSESGERGCGYLGLSVLDQKRGNVLYRGGAFSIRAYDQLVVFQGDTGGGLDHDIPERHIQPLFILKPCLVSFPTLL